VRARGDSVRASLQNRLCKRLKGVLRAPKLGLRARIGAQAGVPVPKPELKPAAPPGSALP
jgi:hypothetical protein